MRGVGPALWSRTRLAPERLRYLATLFRCLAPGLRMACVLLPDVQGSARFLAALRGFADVLAAARLLQAPAPFRGAET